ncbi:MAG: choice-of-anchor Q domain-containing protein, partial [Acidobacteriota bacterium]
LTVDANRTGRIAVVGSFSGVPGDLYRIAGLTLTGGRSDFAGALWALSGSLTLDRVHLVDNETTEFAGGAVEVADDASLAVIRSVIARNSAASAGGGVSSRGDLIVERSAVYGNHAGIEGGGLWIDGTAIVGETTIYGNTSGGTGGGIEVFRTTADLTLYHLSVVGNSSAGAGAGIWLDTDSIPVFGGGNLFARNRSLDRNPGLGATSNCNRHLGLVDQGNLSSDDSCGFTGASDLQNTDPDLLPLLAAGGPTPSVVPAAGSPVIDAAGDVNCLALDQREFLRPVDGDGDGVTDCDIGATEYTPGPDDALVIFADGFESGDLSAWSISSRGG